MSPAFSVYLDLIRFIASLAVFSSHISQRPISEAAVWQQLGAYGDIAVTIFFVLSRYVIAHVASHREGTPAKFLASRVARLYSVVLVALPLTFVVDRAGMHLNPDFYWLRDVLWKPESWSAYISSLFFVNEFQIFQFNGITAGSNAPYWSLSFEAAYYFLAGVALFCRRLVWIPIAMIFLALAGPTIAALLPIWLLGFYLYRGGGAWRLPFRVAVAVGVGSIALIAAVPWLALHLPADNFGGWLPWGRGPFNRNLIQDYLVACAFAAHLIAARSLFSEAGVFGAKAARVIRWLGSLTFPLYCFHFPLICLLAAVSPWGRGSRLGVMFIAIVTFAVVVVLTPLCDALKIVIRDRTLMLIDFLRRLFAHPMAPTVAPAVPPS